VIAGAAMMFCSHGMEMNQFYESSAVVTDGGPAPQPDKDPEFWYFRSTYPDRHLIHAWLTRDQRPVALIDLVGHGRFTLLTGVTGGAAWRVAVTAALAEFGVEVGVVTIGHCGDYEDSWGTYAATREVAVEDGALLVRPDHIIGWRAGDGTDATARLTAALRQILSR